jgi:hypothetical protein
MFAQVCARHLYTVPHSPCSHLCHRLPHWKLFDDGTLDRHGDWGALDHPITRLVDHAPKTRGRTGPPLPVTSVTLADPPAERSGCFFAPTFPAELRALEAEYDAHCGDPQAQDALIQAALARWKLIREVGGDPARQEERVLTRCLAAR